MIFVHHLTTHPCLPSVVADQLQHWANKDEWLGDVQRSYKEIWHGSRFKELSYFWDPNIETVLPVCCPNCDSIISVEKMASFLQDGYTLYDKVRLYMSCQECLFDFTHVPQTMKGCPLNQAFIFHEDGFNAFERKSRGISAIHISSACITKEERSHGKYLRVFSFVPSVLLPEGVPHKFDAFLKPLLNEVKELYINGINVTIEDEIALETGISIEPGGYQVRALLLLGTADIKGHQEMVLHAGGKFYIF